jgi:hypothetical protein
MHREGLIRGENMALVEHLIRARRAARGLQQNDYEKKIASRTWFPAWFNACDYFAMDSGLRTVIWGLCGAERGARIAGYKEIRHGLPNSMPLLEFVSDLVELFAKDLRIITLTRDIEQMLTSIKNCSWEQRPDLQRYRVGLETQQAGYREIARLFPDCVQGLTYEDLLESNPRLHEAFKFIGVPFSVSAWREAVQLRIAE